MFPVVPVMLAACCCLPPAAHALKVGAAAPDFTARDADGKTQTLSQYKGKFIVLEWTNRDCPFTKKHYESGNMERLQKQWGAKGVVWLSVLSSAPGQEGYGSAAEETAYLRKMDAAPHAAILDADGTLGRLYEAKTTPDMFVISPAGTLIYEGAIDDKPTPDAGDIKAARNYVSAALSEAMAGQPVTTSVTRPYGCSVKYGDASGALESHATR